MSYFNAKLLEVARKDRRYAYEAYEFIFQALEHTHKLLGREPPGEDADPRETRFHVSGPQLVDGIRDCAIQQFGLMAPVVLRQWGIKRTDDVGEIVFNLIEAELMSKTDEDRREDFNGLFDLEAALTEDFKIVLEDD